MKTLLIFFCLFVGCYTLAQAAPTSLRKRIVDDEKTLSIQVDGVLTGRQIHYRQTFNVAGMNRLQKEWLTFKAFQAQGIPSSIHELSWLLLLVCGVILLLITLLITIYQTQEAGKFTRIEPA